jgi:hypothetical protein
MGQASLEVLKKLGESNPMNFNNALQQQFLGSEVTSLLKASLQANKQLTNVSMTVFTNLFYTQLKLLNVGVSNETMKELTDTGTNFVKDFFKIQLQQLNSTLSSDATDGLQQTVNIGTDFIGSFFKIQMQMMGDFTTMFTEYACKVQEAQKKVPEGMSKDDYMSGLLVDFIKKFTQRLNDIINGDLSLLITSTMADTTMLTKTL